MLGIEQRVKTVEERVADHNEALKELRQGLQQFENRVDARFAEIGARLTALNQKIDTGLAALNQKLDTGLAAVNQRLDVGLAAVNQRIDAVNQKTDVGFAAVNQKIDTEIAALRHDMATQFRWTIGILLSGFIGILTAMVGMFTVAL